MSKRQRISQIFINNQDQCLVGAMNRDTNTLVGTTRTDNKDSKRDTSKLNYILNQDCKFWAETRGSNSTQTRAESRTSSRMFDYNLNNVMCVKCSKRYKLFRRECNSRHEYLASVNCGVLHLEGIKLNLQMVKRALSSKKFQLIDMLQLDQTFTLSYNAHQFSPNIFFISRYSD